MIVLRSFDRRVLALAFLTLVLATVAVARGGEARAASIPTDYSCTVAGLTGTVTVPITATDAPDPVIVGGAVALTVQTGVPIYPGFNATVRTITLSFARPANVASIDGVSFSGGNLAGTSTVTASGVDLTFSGAVPSAAVVLPTFTISATVAAATQGQTITWAAPATAGAVLDVGGTVFGSDCTRAASAAPLATTAIGAPTTTTTTTSSTTTTAPTTTTTVPATPKISINDLTVAENGGSAVFTVTLDRPATARTVVTYATADGTAIAGSDFTAKTGSVTFAVGQTSKTISVNLRNDAISEPTETFSVNLSLTGSGLNPALAHKLTGVATITDDDTATFSVVSKAVAEGNRVKTINVNVRLTRSSSTQVVSWTTENGTALAGSDYVATAGSLTFAAGDTVKAVTITVNGDRVVEPDETFNIRLLSVTGTAVIGNPVGVVTLTNDD